MDWRQKRFPWPQPSPALLDDQMTIRSIGIIAGMRARSALNAVMNEARLAFKMLEMDTSMELQLIAVSNEERTKWIGKTRTDG